MTRIHTAAGAVNISRAGAGPDLCLVLPPSTGPQGVATLCDGLAEKNHTLQYAQRGIPGGPPLDSSLHVDQLADDLEALFAALEIDDAALVCHSTGCGIGISLAARYPARVTSLVLINPWSWGDPHLTTMQTLRQAAARALDAEQYARFNSALLFPHDYRRKHQAGFDALSRAAAAPDAQSFATRLDAIMRFDARPLLEKIPCPLLVMGARDDQLMPHWSTCRQTPRPPSDLAAT